MNIMDTKRRKFVELNIRTKKQVLDLIDQGVSQRMLSKMYGVAKSTIGNINKNRKSITSAWEENVDNCRRRIAPNSDEESVNSRVLDYFYKCLASNIPVSGGMLQKKAREIAHRLQVDDFDSGPDWLVSFETKNNIELQPAVEITEVKPNLAKDQMKQLNVVKAQKPENHFRAKEADSMPLQKRLLVHNPAQVQIPALSPALLQSQPLSPTKLKVTRQYSRPPQFIPKLVETPPVVQPSEEVCLRWNSHHSNMQTAFPLLLEREQYVDVTLAADGKTLKCHKVILSSCSSYFEEILNGISPLQHPVIFLRDIPFWILKSLTDFMYAGEVNIDQNKLQQLLDVAELLQIKGLAGKTSTAAAPNHGAPEPVRSPQVPATKPVAAPQPSILMRNVPHANSFESVPISDPLELLEPSFQEDDLEPSTSKLKENKFFIKKPLMKKIRKRKSPEHEPSPPPFHIRRGTRSRPNIKVPKYYHSEYEDNTKPHATEVESDHPYNVNNIKAEPIDVEEIDINYDEMEDCYTQMDLDYENINASTDSSMLDTSNAPDSLDNSRRYFTRRSTDRPGRIEVKNFAQLLKSQGASTDGTRVVIKKVVNKIVSEPRSLLKKKKPFAEGSVTIRPLEMPKHSIVIRSQNNENAQDSPIIILTSSVDRSKSVTQPPKPKFGGPPLLVIKSNETNVESSPKLNSATSDCDIDVLGTAEPEQGPEDDDTEITCTPEFNLTICDVKTLAEDEDQSPQHTETSESELKAQDENKSTDSDVHVQVQVSLPNSSASVEEKGNGAEGDCEREISAGDPPEEIIKEAVSSDENNVQSRPGNEVQKPADDCEKLTVPEIAKDEQD